MVKSVINPTNIDYSDDTKFDNDDIHFSTTIYDYSIYGLDIEIALGKEKYSYSTKYNIIYFSIYLVVSTNEDDMAPVSRIGIFEVDSNDFINTFDEDGNIDFSQGNIIIFETEPNILKYINTNQPAHDNSDNNNIVDVDVTELLDDDSTSVMRLNIDDANKTINTSPTLNETKQILNDGIFTIDNTITQLPLLPDETVIDSDIIKNDYLESIQNNWVERFTKNNNYAIIDNEGSGDCLFAVIRDAFQQIGHKTTVTKLRALVAKEATDDVFNGYKHMYNDFTGEIQNIDALLKETKQTNTKLAKRSQNRKLTKTDHKQLLDTASSLDQTYQQLILSKKETKDLLKEFAFMKGINSIEQFRETILSSQYWADSWAITTIERVLNVKVIILSYESYNNDDMDGIMQCGEQNNDVNKPDYYIIASYTGKHYTLIEYKNKRIYNFREIPYDIKTMIINKCLERNSGPYYLIDDFRNYKTKLGLDSNYGEPNDNENEFMNSDIYDKDTVFSFYRNSNPKPKAGKGSGETIDTSNIITFATLNSTDTNNCCYDWRKKLDDTWTKSPFKIDGTKWASVKHYVLGAQYKKGFTDFYLQFSLDSDSAISKDIDLAIAAASKSGKIKDKQLRPDTVKQDPDYYEYGVNNRYDIERLNALTSKFSQNTDLNKLLTTTYPAKLIQFVRGKEHEPDEQLMKLRRELLNPNQ